MTRDIVARALRDQPDLEVVATLDSPDELVALCRRAHPDCVVAGVEGAELPPPCRAVLAEQPHVRIIGLEEDGRGHRHELAARVTTFPGPVSVGELVSAVRSAALAPPDWGTA